MAVRAQTQVPGVGLESIPGGCESPLGPPFSVTNIVKNTTECKSETQNVDKSSRSPFSDLQDRRSKSRFELNHRLKRQISLGLDDPRNEGLRHIGPPSQFSLRPLFAFEQSYYALGHFLLLGFQSIHRESNKGLVGESSTIVNFTETSLLGMRSTIENVIL